MALTPSEADEFCRYLVETRIIHHLGNRRRFAGKASDIYRLQCLMAPDVLNAFCFWTAPVNENIVSIVEVLMRALTKLEKDALTVNGSSGKIDYKKVKSNVLYLPFQESICELQDASLDGLSHKAKLATCLNIYALMLRFAFIKVGIPSEEEIPAFLNAVKFKVQGNVFTLQEWMDGVLRGNKKSGISNKIPFPMKDPRKDMVLQEFDNRVHFALNCGFSIGSTSSLPYDIFASDAISEQLE
jgi:hypothetical protein